MARKGTNYMKRLNMVKEAKIIHLVASAILLLSGIFLIVFFDVAKPAVRWLIAAGLILCGIARTMGYFANDLYRLAFQYDFAAGGLSLIMGVLLLFAPEQVLDALPYALGCYVVLDGLLKIQTAFDAKAFGMKKWIGLLIFAILVAICGIVVLIGSTQWNRIVLLGVAIAVDGAENFWNTMATVRVRAKKEDRFGELL